jgi:hypothetical protein
MFKKAQAISLLSVIAFCVISYISVMISLLGSLGDLTKKPVTNLGFPFKYYSQFWVGESDSPNCGWRIDYFIIDFWVVWELTGGVYLFVKRKKQASI